MDKAVLIRNVVKIIRENANPERIWLYGSQATGDEKVGSDIDIAFSDENNVDIEKIKAKIDELPSLIRVDVSNIKSADSRFANRVRDTGKVLFSASKKLRAEDGLHNYLNALERFSNIVGRKDEFTNDGYGDIYLDLAVKRFEFTYEMAWKAIKRYIQFLGLECKSPRACIMEAYTQAMIKDENVWLDMIEMRNRTSHAYDESEVSELLDKLSSYQVAFNDLYLTVEEGLSEP